jgi:hypothetical protein
MPSQKGGGVSWSPKKKSKKKKMDSANEDEDKISDDIIRAVLNRRLGEQDTESSEDQGEITKEIEVCLGKSEGELLQCLGPTLSQWRVILAARARSVRPQTTRAHSLSPMNS